MSALISQREGSEASGPVDQDRTDEQILVRLARGEEPGQIQTDLDVTMQDVIRIAAAARSAR
jgi:hypothetical protein